MANRPKKCTNFFGLIFMLSRRLFFKTALLIAACNLNSCAQQQQKNVFVLTQNLKEGGVEYDSPARDVSGKGSFFEQ
mgnify:CR=1 FL=1